MTNLKYENRILSRNLNLSINLLFLVEIAKKTFPTCIVEVDPSFNVFVGLASDLSPWRLTFTTHTIWRNFKQMESDPLLTANLLHTYKTISSLVLPTHYITTKLCPEVIITPFSIFKNDNGNRVFFKGIAFKIFFYSNCSKRINHKTWLNLRIVKTKKNI